MKVSLVVAAGVHQGKAIPIPGPQFLIGRDPECQLRPASQAVSKQHCAVVVRGGKVFVKDYGSTNGTFVNGEQLPANAEREVQNGDRLKLGPLDFRIEFSAAPSSAATPVPDALKPVGTKPASSATQKAVPKPEAAAPEPPRPQPIPGPRAADDDHDAAAALLLGMGDEEPGAQPQVPDGSTVFDMSAVNGPQGGQGKPEEKPGDKKNVPSREDTSSAASDILRKYMRRPR